MERVFDALREALAAAPPPTAIAPPPDAALRAADRHRSAGVPQQAARVGADALAAPALGAERTRGCSARCAAPPPRSTRSTATRPPTPQRRCWGHLRVGARLRCRRSRRPGERRAARAHRRRRRRRVRRPPRVARRAHRRRGRARRRDAAAQPVHAAALRPRIGALGPPAAAGACCRTSATASPPSPASSRLPRLLVEGCGAARGARARPRHPPAMPPPPPRSRLAELGLDDSTRCCRARALRQPDRRRLRRRRQRRRRRGGARS